MKVGIVEMLYEDDKVAAVAVGARVAVGATRSAEAYDVGSSCHGVRSHEIV